MRLVSLTSSHGKNFIFALPWSPHQVAKVAGATGKSIIVQKERDVVSQWITHYKIWYCSVHNSIPHKGAVLSSTTSEDVKGHHWNPSRMNDKE